jgi:serine/threonine-protein kinase
MTVTAELRTDQVLAGTYRIERLLGRGGMGAVYQAEHLRTRKLVALKTLRPGFGKIREIAKRFEREALTTSLLSHPGVVQVDDYGELEDGALFLVMELVPGASLREIIDAGPVAPARAFAIVRQILDALAHAHAAGVIHRDLKPDNVKVMPDPDRPGEERVKILDFGIAKVVGAAEEAVGDEKLTEAGIAFGTPDYMAPEQALGQSVDARADLYSVGVMLFEMLAGRRPCVSDEAIAVARMHVGAPAP